MACVRLIATLYSTLPASVQSPFLTRVFTALISALNSASDDSSALDLVQAIGSVNPEAFRSAIASVPGAHQAISAAALKQQERQAAAAKAEEERAAAAAATARSGGRRRGGKRGGKKKGKIELKMKF